MNHSDLVGHFIDIFSPQHTLIKRYLIVKYDSINMKWICFGIDNKGSNLWYKYYKIYKLLENLIDKIESGKLDINKCSSFPKDLREYILKILNDIKDYSYYIAYNRILNFLKIQRKIYLEKMDNIYKQYSYESKRIINKMFKYLIKYKFIRIIKKVLVCYLCNRNKKYCKKNIKYC